jgi:hypothetical protein
MSGHGRQVGRRQVHRLALEGDQAELVKALRAGPVNLGTAVPAGLRGQPGIFLTAAEWKERGYIMNDEARGKTLPAWREWFTANIVKK